MLIFRTKKLHKSQKQQKGKIDANAVQIILFSFQIPLVFHSWDNFSIYDEVFLKFKYLFWKTIGLKFTYSERPHLLILKDSPKIYLFWKTIGGIVKPDL